METVNHPDHYQNCCEETKEILTLLGVPFWGMFAECIVVIEYMDKIKAYPYGMFHIGSAMKYLWRADTKGDMIENLEKSKFYIKRYRRIVLERTKWKRFFRGESIPENVRLIEAIEEIDNLIIKIKQKKEIACVADTAKIKEESDIFVKVSPMENLQNSELVAWD